VAEDDIIKNSPISPGKKIEPIGEQPNLEKQLGSQQPAPFNLQGAAAPTKVEAVNPMEAASQTQAAAQPTGPQVTQNMQNLLDQINSVKEKLQNPRLSLSTAEQQVAQYRLNRLQDNLNVISGRLGMPQKAETVAPKSNATTTSSTDGKPAATAPTPIETYLNYLTEGQKQLDDATSALKGLNADGGAISTGDLMAIQLKVNGAQQEIQFFSALLGQSLDALKGLMNTQM
jgi:aspartate ammonia-lyase